MINRKDRYFTYYHKLSEKYGLPIITSNCPRYKGGFYSTDGNDWELPKTVTAPHHKKFNKIRTRWIECLENFCQEQGLQSSGFLGVGLSTGAQFLNRVAMTHPTMFHSMDSSLPGSNPTPSPDCKHIHWLHISGGRDGGYQNCNRFYEKAISMGYKRMHYLAPHDVGHGRTIKSPHFNSFRKAFYNYVLSSKEKPAKPYVLIGDYLNHVYTPAEKADWIPENQRVYFSDGKMAKAWGPIIK